jgi:uncharacterized SAM-binding protein YcdF (DUF218 family)
LIAAAAWQLVAWAAARALVVSEPLGRAEAVVVLSGSSAYVERTRFAARLWREGRAPKIVLTNDGQRGGWSSAEQRNPYFSERAAWELQRAGVPAASIEVLPRPITSTYDEAALLRRHADERGLRSLLVVTSAYHTRRARWSLRRAFAGSDAAVGVEPVVGGEQSPRPALWWLSPRGWDAVAGEYVKLLYYRLHYAG